MENNCFYGLPADLTDGSRIDAPNRQMGRMKRNLGALEDSWAGVGSYIELGGVGRGLDIG